MENITDTSKKILSVDDVEDIIREFTTHYQYTGEAGSPYGSGYNNAITECITILKNRLRGT